MDVSELSPKKKLPQVSICTVPVHDGMYVNHTSRAMKLSGSNPCGQPGVLFGISSPSVVAPARVNSVVPSPMRMALLQASFAGGQGLNSHVVPSPLYSPAHWKNGTTTQSWPSTQQAPAHGAGSHETPSPKNWPKIAVQALAVMN